MKAARLKPPPLPPLLRPMRLPVPDFQGLDSPPVSSDDESEYYVSDEDHNSTDEECEGYDLDLEYDKPIWKSNFQQVDESEGVDFPAVLDAPPVKEEINSSKDESEDHVSNEDDNSTKDEGKRSIGNVGIVRHSGYDPDLEYDRPIWESYYRKVDESKGFDIKEDYPGPRPLPTLYTIPYDRKTFRMLKGYAESALKKYNDDKGTNHVIENVLNAKGCGCREKVVNVKGGGCHEEVVNVEGGGRGRREKVVNAEGGGRRDKVVNVEGGGCCEKVVNIEGGGCREKVVNVKRGGCREKFLNVKGGGCREKVVNVKGCGCHEKFLNVKGGGCREKVVNVKGCGCREKFLNVKGGGCREKVLNVKRGRCREKFMNVKGGGCREKVVNVKQGGCLVKFLNVKGGGCREKVVNVKGGGCRDYVYYLMFSAKTGDEKVGYFQAMVVKDQEDNLDFPVFRPTVRIDMDGHVMT